MSHLRWTASRQVDGTQILEVSILRVVLVLLLQVGVLTSCSSTTHILSKTLLMETSLCLRKHMNGLPLVHVPVLCQVVE